MKEVFSLTRGETLASAVCGNRLETRRDPSRIAQQQRTKSSQRDPAAVHHDMPRISVRCRMDCMLQESWESCMMRRLFVVPCAQIEPKIVNERTHTRGERTKRCFEKHIQPRLPRKIVYSLCVKFPKAKTASRKTMNEEKIEYFDMVAPNWPRSKRSRHPPDMRDSSFMLQESMLRNAHLGGDPSRGLTLYSEQS